MKLSHATLITLSGLVWLAVGFYLLPLGLRLLLTAMMPTTPPTSLPLIEWMWNAFATPEQAIQLLIIVGLVIGFIKGRLVLGKAVTREVGRIRALPNPTSLRNLYGVKAIVVVAIMMCLGMAMKIFAVPPDIRGTIDVAIGAALINGAVLYFRQAALARTQRA